MARTGVRARTTVIALVTLALALGAAGVLVVVLLSRQLDGTVTDSVLSTARQVADEVSAEGVNRREMVGLLGSRDAAVTQVLDGTGSVVARSQEATGQPPLTDARPLPGREIIRTGHLTLPNQVGEFRIAAIGVTGPDGTYTVISARSMTFVTEPTDRLALVVTVVFLALMVVAAIAAYGAVGAALRPVERMRRTVADISTTDLSTRVAPPPGRDEVHRLAITLNDLLDRLASAQAAQRRFIADASHELRSPLSAITTALSVADRHPYASTASRRRRPRDRPAARPRRRPAPARPHRRQHRPAAPVRSGPRRPAARGGTTPAGVHAADGRGRRDAGEGAG